MYLIQVTRYIYGYCGLLISNDIMLYVCCEIIGCTNEATETIDIVMPWKTDEPGKWYLCRKCKHGVNRK